MICFVPQPRHLLGSSTQNNSGVQCALVQAPGQLQRGSGEGSKRSEEGPGGFGAEPGRVQQGSGKGSGAGVRFWCRKGLGSTGLRRFREGSGRLWCKTRSRSTGFQSRFRTRSGRLWYRARSGSTKF